jgi:hypothetical protein
LAIADLMTPTTAISTPPPTPPEATDEMIETDIQAATCRSAGCRSAEQHAPESAAQTAAKDTGDGVAKRAEVEALEDFARRCCRQCSACDQAG